MTRAARWLLSIGLVIFIAVLASQGLSTVVSTLSLAGWGLVLVALYHLVPLILDAAAIRVLFAVDGAASHGATVDAATVDAAAVAGTAEAGAAPMREAILARWVGESANSLMPGGQIGGPVLMARHLALRGMPLPEAVATITVSTTLQTFAQIGFALVGVSLLGAHATHVSQSTLRNSSLLASAFLALQIGGFYLLQRRGFFSRLLRAAARFVGKRDWSDWASHARAIDAAVETTYRRRAAVAGSFGLSLIGWLVGTVEVYWILQLLASPVSWSDALMLESLGQAIRGAAFAIPGALGVQEGGYLLLGALVGLHAETGLALSLAKRARELLLGLPGLVYLQLAERGGGRTVRPARP
jgi:putative membrane protein